MINEENISTVQSAASTSKGTATTTSHKGSSCTSHDTSPGPSNRTAVLENSCGRKRKISPVPKGKERKKMATQDEVLKTINNTWQKFENVLTDNEAKTSGTSFGHLVGIEIDSISDKRIKYQTMAKILQILQQVNTPDDSDEN